MVADRPRKRIKVEDDHATTIRLIGDIGTFKFDEGNTNEAEKYYKQALYAACSKLPSNRQLSAKTTKAMNSEKEGSQQAGEQRQNFNEGMHVYHRPIPIKSHADSIEAIPSLLYNLALIQVKYLNYIPAAHLFSDALARISNFESKGTVMATLIEHNLGHCFYRLGKTKRAMKHYKRALYLASTTKSHHVGTALNCVGVLYCYLQKPEKALQHFERSLDLALKYRGSTTCEVAIIYNNVGSAHYLAEKFEQALKAYDKALMLRRLLLGSDSLDVAATVLNIGLTQHRLMNLNAALTHYEEFIRIANTQLSKDTRDVMITYIRMGEIHRQKKEPKKAIALFEKALTAGRSTLGQAHPEIASILNRLGNLCCETKELNRALEYYEDGLKTEKSIWGSNHPHIIITMTNIAHLLKHKGDVASALITFRVIRNLQIDSLGSSHLSVAETFSSEGLLQYSIGRFEAAFDSYQHALRIRREHYRSDYNVEVASTLNSLALVAFKLGLYDIARNSIAKGLSILKDIVGEDSQDMAILWYNIATIYYETGESENLAMQYFKETLRIERKSLGDDHPDVVQTILYLGQKHHQAGELDDALEWFNEALCIERNRKEPSKSSVAKILGLIGNIHLQKGEIEDMMKCFSEASRLFEGSTLIEGSPSIEEATLVIAGYNFYGLSKIHPPCAPTA